MFNKELKIGDYVFSLNGGCELSRISKVNKTTYTVISVLTGCSSTITFNGISTRTYDYYPIEWFYCDDVTAKTLELYYERIKKQYVKKLKELQDRLDDLEDSLTNKVKEFKGEIGFELDEEEEED